MSIMKTFDNQFKLPRLPIPTLQHTASLYLKSLQPLVKSGNIDSAEYESYVKIVQDFISPNGLGSILQSRLLAHDQTLAKKYQDCINQSNFIIINFLII